MYFYLPCIEINITGRDVYFWLNHPIRFVRLVGIVCAIDSVGNGKYTILTLDDSSGADIEIRIERRDVKFGDDVEYPSNTLVDNVNVSIKLGLPVVSIDKTQLCLGTVIRAEGMITSYRSQKQLLLRRVFHVKDTNEEAIAWSKTAHWKRTVLSQAWVLTAAKKMEIDETVRREEKESRDRADRKRKWQEEYDKTKRRKEEKDEERNRRLEKKLNSGALDGTGVLRMPGE